MNRIMPAIVLFVSLSTVALPAGAADNKASVKSVSGASVGDMKAKMEERKKIFQSLKELDGREAAELKALALEQQQARKARQAEIKAAEEQLKALRSKRGAELDTLLKREKATRDKYRAERAALMKSLAPRGAAERAPGGVTSNSMLKPAAPRARTGK